LTISKGALAVQTFGSNIELESFRIQTCSSPAGTEMALEMAAEPTFQVGHTTCKDTCGAASILAGLALSLNDDRDTLATLSESLSIRDYTIKLD
jgi:hypothetical protein